METTNLKSTTYFQQENIYRHIRFANRSDPDHGVQAFLCQPDPSLTRIRENFLK